MDNSKKPIHCYRMDSEGQLIDKVYENYVIYVNRRGNTVYEFSAPGSCRTRTADKMGKCIGGIVCTLNNDPESAKELILKYWEQRKRRAESELNICIKSLELCKDMSNMTTVYPQQS